MIDMIALIPKPISTLAFSQPCNTTIPCWRYLQLLILIKAMQ